MPILSPVDHTAIRAALSVEMTADDLPDDLIDNDIFYGQAERFVERAYPNWATLAPGSAPLRRLQNAVIYRTAAALCASFPWLRSSQTGDIADDFVPTDPSGCRARLERLASAELALVIHPDNPRYAPVLFTKALGGRVA